MENNQTVSPENNCRGCLQKMVIYERFKLNCFGWETFGVLNRWSPMGGGRLRLFPFRQRSLPC